MKDTKPYKAIEKFFAVLKPMTWKERVQHIWNNYKIWLLVIVLAIIWLVNTLTRSDVSAADQVTGVNINVTLSQEGREELETKWLEGMEKTGKLSEVSFSEELAESDFYNYYNQVMKVSMLVGAKEVDFFLADQEGMEQYIAHDIYLDLRQVLLQEEIDGMIEKIIHCTPLDSNGEPTEAGNIPIAIDITELPFTKANIQCEGKVFLAFAGNAPNMELMGQLWAYISQWESQ